MSLPNQAPSHQAPPSVEDLLFGSGPSRKGRSLSFLSIGDSHTLTVTGKEVRQKLDDDGQPATWSDGNPIWQIILTGETGYRSPDIEDDDGVRYLYIEGSLKRSSKSKMAAFAAALEAAGIDSVELGGKLTITYVGNGEKTSADPRKSAPKQFEATFVRPVDVATQAAVQGGNGQASAPAQAAPPPSSNGGNLVFDATQVSYLNDAQLAFVQSQGMTTEAVKAMFPPPPGWSPQAASGDPMAQFEPRLNRNTVKAKVPSITDAQLNAFEAANLDTATVLNMFGASV